MTLNQNVTQTPAPTQVHSHGLLLGGQEAPIRSHRRLVVALVLGVLGSALALLLWRPPAFGLRI